MDKNIIIIIGVICVSVSSIVSIILGATGYLFFDKKEEVKPENTKDIFFKHKSSNKCLDRDGNKNIIIQDCNKKVSQTWTYENNTIKSANSNSCIDSDGITAYVNTCNNTSSQKWNFDKNLLTHVQSRYCLSNIDNQIILSNCGTPSYSEWSIQQP